MSGASGQVVHVEQHAMYLKARIRRARIAETFVKQGRRQQHYHGERRFRTHQPVAQALVGTTTGACSKLCLRIAACELHGWSQPKQDSASDAKEDGEQ